MEKEVRLFLDFPKHCSSHLKKMIEILKKVFYIGCFIAAMYFFGSCIQEYALNEDTSIVRFKSFHEDENSLYPSLTLCFGDFWRDADLDFLDDLDFDAFEKYLSGCEGYPKDPFQYIDYECTWNKSYENVEYDKVSIDLMDYVMAEMTVFEDDSTYKYAYMNGDPNSSTVWNEASKEMFFPGYSGGTRVYTSKRTSDSKCMTFDMPFRKQKLMRHHSILLDNSIFKTSGLDRRERPDDLFQAYFHFPHQTLKKTSKKSRWTDARQLIKSCEGLNFWDLLWQACLHPYTYTMTFNVDHVAVVRRRNKRREGCISGWGYDEDELTKIAANVQCKPKHWNTTTYFPPCEEMRSMNYLHKAIEKVPPVPSCYSIERYSYRFVEKAGLDSFSNVNDLDFNDKFGIYWDWYGDQGDNSSILVSEIKIVFDGMKLP